MIQKIRIFMWRYAIAGYETKRKARSSGWTLRKRLSPYVLWWTLVSLFFNHQDVSQRFFKACSSAKVYRKMALLSFTGYNPKLTWNKEWFDELITLPFEFTDIVCPKAYDQVLRTQYGNYMEYVKGGQIHTMVLFDADIPYKEKIAINSL